MDIDPKIAVIGLGYVGLPLAVEFGKRYHTIGFDLKEKRVQELRAGKDVTLEVEESSLRQASLLSYTTQWSDIAGCTVYVIAVPTPVDP